MKRLFLSRSLWILLVLAIAAGLIVWGKYSAKEKQETLTSREIALTCTTDMATEYHIHPTLSIVVNGENVPIPANIGVESNCMTSLHTHDAIGTIHVEAPIKKDFTLGDFFAAWDKPFNKDQILDYKIYGTKAITVTVNGIKVDTYENTILKDKDKIVIRYE